MLKAICSLLALEISRRIYLIGRFPLPPDCCCGFKLGKIEATQRAQQRENELREAEAQAKKRNSQV